MATAPEMRAATQEVLRRMQLFEQQGGRLPAVVVAAATRAMSHLESGRAEQALIMLVAVCDKLVTPGIQEAINAAYLIYDPQATVTPIDYDPDDRSDLPVRVDGVGAGRVTEYVAPTPIQLARRLLKYCRGRQDFEPMRMGLITAQLMVDADEPERALEQIRRTFEELDADGCGPMIHQINEVLSAAKDDRFAIVPHDA